MYSVYDYKTMVKLVVKGIIIIINIKWVMNMRNRYAFRTKHVFYILLTPSGSVSIRKEEKFIGNDPYLLQKIRLNWVVSWLFMAKTQVF